MRSASTFPVWHLWIIIPIVVLGITTSVHATYDATPGATLDNPYFFTGRITDTLHADQVLAECPAGDPECVEGTHTDADFRRIQDNRNRAYDPKHGRWLQRDPLGVNLDADPAPVFIMLMQQEDGCNVYQYARSTPAVRKDPQGELSSCDEATQDAKPAYVFRQDPIAKDHPIWEECRSATRSLPPRAACLVGKMMKKGCAVPKFHCVCCAGSAKGCHDLQGQGGRSRVFLCVNNLGARGGPSQVVAAIEHEVSHAWEACKTSTAPAGTPSVSTCDQKACEEVKAVYCSGACDLNGPARKPGERFFQCLMREAKGTVSLFCGKSQMYWKILGKYKNPVCRDCEVCPP